MVFSTLRAYSVLIIINRTNNKSLTVVKNRVDRFAVLATIAYREVIRYYTEGERPLPIGSDHYAGLTNESWKSVHNICAASRLASGLGACYCERGAEGSTRIPHDHSSTNARSGSSSNAWSSVCRIHFSKRNRYN